MNARRSGTRIRRSWLASGMSTMSRIGSERQRRRALRALLEVETLHVLYADLHRVDLFVRPTPKERDKNNKEEKHQPIIDTSTPSEC